MVRKCVNTVEDTASYCDKDGKMPVIPVLWEGEAGEMQVQAQPGQLRDLARRHLKKAGDAAQCDGLGSIFSAKRGREEGRGREKGTRRGKRKFAPGTEHEIDCVS